MPNPAWKFQHSVECNTNRSFAWSFWTDISNWERLEGKAVDWIRLHGPFAEGSSGETKMPGQNPQYWKITQVEPEHSATIEMPIDGAVFYNRMIFTSLSSKQTLITQIMSLVGPKAPEFAPGMQVFETSAPQGLAKIRWPGPLRRLMRKTKSLVPQSRYRIGLGRPQRMIAHCK